MRQLESLNSQVAGECFIDSSRSQILGTAVSAQPFQNYVKQIPSTYTMKIKGVGERLPPPSKVIKKGFTALRPRLADSIARRQRHPDVIEINESDSITIQDEEEDEAASVPSEDEHADKAAKLVKRPQAVRAVVVEPEHKDQPSDCSSSIAEGEEIFIEPFSTAANNEQDNHPYA